MQPVIFQAGIFMPKTREEDCMAAKKNTTVTAKGGKEYAYYRITRTIGHEWKDGKKVPVKKQFVGTSKGNAEQKFKKYQEEQIRIKYEKEHLQSSQQRRAFGDYAEEYTYGILMKSSYAHGTKRRYEQSYRVHVKDSLLASIPLGDVKARTIQDFYISLDVSRQSLKAISKWMSAFYKWLSLNEYSNNVLSAVTLPDKPDNKRHTGIVVWEPGEITSILANASSHRLRFMMFLMNYAGLRISECLGIKYMDISNGFVHVNRQYYQGELSPPKHKSFRKIPIHPELQKAFNAHRERFTAEAQRNKYKTDFVFTSSTGKLLEYGNVRRSLTRFYKRNEIPEKNPHAYRATFCTELCRAGVPLEVASKLMGHKSVEVTARHYALIKQDVQIEAINNLPGISLEPANKFRPVRTAKRLKKIKR